MGATDGRSLDRTFGELPNESQIITDLGSPAMVLTDLVEQLAALLGAVAKGDVAAVSRFPAWRYLLIIIIIIVHCVLMLGGATFVSLFFSF